MNDQTEEWREPWEQAATERDPDRVIQLLERVDRLLEERQQRLRMESESHFEKKAA